MLVHNFSDCQAALRDWLQLPATFSPAPTRPRWNTVFPKRAPSASYAFRGHFLLLLFHSPSPTDKKVKGQEVGVSLKCARPTRAF